MLQRIQTLWLLLAAICGIFSYAFPLYVGSKPGELGSVPQIVNLTTLNNFGLLVLVYGAAVLALVTIFLYKNRKLQLRLCIGGVLLTFFALVVTYFRIQNFNPGGTIGLGMIIPVAMLVLFVMAARGIYKDEKLVKSLDRLR
jgi:DMSO reductase anchor subunit